MTARKLLKTFFFGFRLLSHQRHLMPSPPWQMRIIFILGIIIISIETFMGSKFPFSEDEGQCERSTNNYRLALQRCENTAIYTIHGLWPQWDGGQYCQADAFSVTPLFDILDDLNRFWPSCSESFHDNEWFWAHEWNKHGSCSGLTLREYFSMAINLRESSVNNCLFKDSDCSVCFSKNYEMLTPPRQIPYSFLLLLGICYLGVCSGNKIFLQVFITGQIIFIVILISNLAYQFGMLYGTKLMLFTLQQNALMKDPEANNITLEPALPSGILLTLFDFTSYVLTACLGYDLYKELTTTPYHDLDIDELTIP